MIEDRDDGAMSWRRAERIIPPPSSPKMGRWAGVVCKINKIESKNFRFFIFSIMGKAIAILVTRWYNSGIKWI